MDQKTIDDKVNALLEEHNSLSMASPVVRTHQKSVNSPALVAATLGKEKKQRGQMLRLRGRRRLRLRKKLMRIRKKRLKLRKKRLKLRKKWLRLRKKRLS
ncbi:unnamed protein product [Brassica oleracea var. botrytis]